MSSDIYLPYTAKIIERRQESADVFTLGLEFIDATQQAHYQFMPGQFNMVYLFGVGEVPISIVSTADENSLYYHTIRRLGRVTNGLYQLKIGDSVGIRGPFGHGWPLQQAAGKDILIITGGLGCAPSVSVIHYIVKCREQFGKLMILQGVKHSDDLIYRRQYEQWEKMPNTQILLAASQVSAKWPWYKGLVTGLIDQLSFNPKKTVCMMCGPEAMMIAVAKRLLELNLPDESIYLSLERNMECAVGHCGHCQLGGTFVCKDGPVLNYPRVKRLLGQKGF